MCVRGRSALSAAVGSTASRANCARMESIKARPRTKNQRVSPKQQNARAAHGFRSAQQHQRSPPLCGAKMGRKYVFRVLEGPQAHVKMILRLQQSCTDGHSVHFTRRRARGKSSRGMTRRACRVVPTSTRSAATATPTPTPTPTPPPRSKCLRLRHRHRHRCTPARRASHSRRVDRGSTSATHPVVLRGTDPFRCRSHGHRGCSVFSWVPTGLSPFKNTTLRRPGVLFFATRATVRARQQHRVCRPVGHTVVSSPLTRWYALRATLRHMDPPSTTARRQCHPCSVSQHV